MAPVKRLFLPGSTTSGHYQIELACGACHSENFADGQAIQSSCERCHSAELKRAQDSHPRAKFTDPRNAERTAQLDASHCVTCHVEHQPEIAADMGVTVPEDYCYRCHQNIAQERPSHLGMAFDSCDDAGCHNFHDNRALYEDFLAKRASQPAQRARQVTLLGLTSSAPTTGGSVLSEKEGVLKGDSLVGWQNSAHATSGLQCAACHAASDGSWKNEVSHQACRGCHERQVSGFLQGRHGMRLAQALPPLRVGEARLPMRAQAAHRELTCGSCHTPHRYDVTFAATDACLGCHNDEHSLAHKNSPHFSTLKKVRESGSPPASGVSCATCHLPRVSAEDATLLFAQHNQNDNLRPNDKMIRSVCLDCHGLRFSINALADVSLVRSNFDGALQVNVPSIELALKRSLKGVKAPAQQ